MQKRLRASSNQPSGNFSRNWSERNHLPDRKPSEIESRILLQPDFSKIKKAPEFPPALCENDPAYFFLSAFAALVFSRSDALMTSIFAPCFISSAEGTRMMSLVSGFG